MVFPFSSISKTKKWRHFLRKSHSHWRGEWDYMLTKHREYYSVQMHRHWNKRALNSRVQCTICIKRDAILFKWWIRKFPWTNNASRAKILTIREKNKQKTIYINLKQTMKGKHWPTENQRNNASINKNKGKCFIAHITIDGWMHNSIEMRIQLRRSDLNQPIVLHQLTFIHHLDKSNLTYHCKRVEIQFSIFGIQYIGNELPVSRVKWQVANGWKRF